MSGPTNIIKYSSASFSHLRLAAMTDFIDLSTFIANACAGPATSDPDIIKPSLSVAITSGSFNSETVTCNQFNWTTHASINDGHGEMAHFTLPTLKTLFPEYDPQLHGIQLVVDLVDIGTLNGTQPIIFLAVKPAGAYPAVAEGAGWAVVSATSLLFEYAIGATAISGMSTINPASILAQGHTRLQLHMGTTIRRRDSWVTEGITEFHAQSSARVVVPMVAATDSLGICLGNVTAVAGAISGLKMRFRIRLYEITNLFMSDLTMGCQY